MSYLYDADGWPVLRILGHDADGNAILEDMDPPAPVEEPEWIDPLGPWSDLDYTTHASWLSAQLDAERQARTPAPDPDPADDPMPAKRTRTRTRTRASKGA